MENKIIRKFLDWKKENPDEDYQYDEIDQIFQDVSRGDLLSFMNEVSGNNAVKDLIQDIILDIKQTNGGCKNCIDDFVIILMKHYQNID